MSTMGLLWLLWHLGQMTKNDKFFLLGRLLKRATHGFLKSFSLIQMAPIFAIPMLSTIYEDPEVSTTDDEMYSALSHSSSVNGQILSYGTDDDEITSRFVESASPATSSGSNSPFGSVFHMADDNDEVSSVYQRA